MWLILLLMVFSSNLISFNLMLFYFISNLFVSNLKTNWYYVYIFLTLLMVFFFNSLLVGSTPFIYILGASMYMLFVISFSSWFISFFGSSLFMKRFHNNSSSYILGIFGFDTFVVLLRPVTLTLRVLINVSLGHFLIMTIHLNFSSIIMLVWLLELFVYLVQSYVFMTLSKSYTESLLAPSLNKNSPFTPESSVGL